MLATPALTIPELLHLCGRMNVGAAIVLAAGFGEAGSAGCQLEERIREVRAEFPSLRVLGPNCLGVIVPSAKLNASFAQGMPPVGRVALFSQSGALCTAILDRAIAENIGFSAMVSLGNILDIGFDDLLDYFAADPNTDAAVLYVESITDARDFMSAARAFSSTRPIVAYKAGRFQQSAQAAASHTGAMAGVDAVYEAAFRRASIVRALDFEELFDTAELPSRSRRPTGSRLAIVTNAGGPGIMAVDALIAAYKKLSMAAVAVEEDRPLASFGLKSERFVVRHAANRINCYVATSTMTRKRRHRPEDRCRRLACLL